MRVEVTSGLGMDETNNGAVGNVSNIGGINVVVRVSAVGIEEPVVVGVLVVIASDLLLLGSLRVSLDVGVQKTTAVSHVLDSSAGSNGNF